MPKSRKRRGFPWRATAIYVLIVAAAGAALVAWDRAYEARRAALMVPPTPEARVTSLVEQVVGPGAVQSIKLDQKTGELEMTVKDIVSQDAKTLDQKKKFLTGEGTVAIQSVLSQMVTLKKVTINLVKDGKVLATVRSVPGVSAPTTDFAPDLK